MFITHKLNEPMFGLNTLQGTTTQNVYCNRFNFLFGKLKAAVVKSRYLAPVCMYVCMCQCVSAALSPTGFPLGPIGLVHRGTQWQLAGRLPARLHNVGQKCYNNSPLTFPGYTQYLNVTTGHHKQASVLLTCVSSKEYSNHIFSSFCYTLTHENVNNN